MASLYSLAKFESVCEPIGKVYLHTCHLGAVMITAQPCTSILVSPFGDDGGFWVQ